MENNVPPLPFGKTYSDRMMQMRVPAISDEDTTIIPNILLTGFQQVSMTDKYIYICLVALCGQDRHCEVLSTRELAKAINLAHVTVWKTLPRLASAGFIQIERVMVFRNGLEGYAITLLDLSTISDEIRNQEKSPRTISEQASFQKESEKVEFHLARARESHLPATLTLNEWLAILDYFNWACAYCGGSYDLLEHFIPTLLGGGTTQKNCVPACVSCNNRKSSYHPLLLPSDSGMSEGIAHVQQYLSIEESLRDNEE